MQRAAAAGRGWRRTSGEKRGDGPPRKVSSFFCLWFLFFLQLNHIICIPTPLSPNASPSPAVPSPSATGELGRISCGHRRFGRHPPRRRARLALLQPSLSAAASAGELLRVRRSLELGRCLLCRLDRRRPLHVSSSAAECKLFFCLWFLYFFFSSIILFFPRTELRASLASDTSALNESAGASLAVVTQRHDLSGFVLEANVQYFLTNIF